MSLAYDKHGTLIANLIVEEYQDLSTNTSVNVFPLQEGTDSNPTSFYEESVILIGSLTTNSGSQYVNMIEDVDFIFGCEYLTQSAITGKRVMNNVLLLKPYKHIKFTYHGVGGRGDVRFHNQLTEAGSFDDSKLSNWLDIMGQRVKVDASSSTPLNEVKTRISTMGIRLQQLHASITEVKSFYPELKATLDNQWEYLRNLSAYIDWIIDGGSGSVGDTTVSDLISLSGLPSGSVNLGTGYSTVPVNSTVKAAMVAIANKIGTGMPSSRRFIAGNGVTLDATTYGDMLKGDLTYRADHALTADLTHDTTVSNKALYPAIASELIMNVIRDKLGNDLGDARHYDIGTGPNQIPTNSMIPPIVIPVSVTLPLSW